MTQSLPATINGRNCYAGGSAPVLALIAFYSAFNRRDPGAMARCWAQGDAISMSNPLGGLNCTGLNCPLPILRLAKAIKALAPGLAVELVATDPGAQKDVAAWAAQTGNDLIETREQDSKYHFVVRKRVS
jgi:tRNA 2-thiouridine synthesizing protein A